MAASKRTPTPPAKPNTQANPTGPNKQQSLSNSVCKFYNSYFGTGCQSGRYCPFKHLKEKEFVMFCRNLQKRSQTDINSKKLFGRAKNHFNQNRIKKSFDIFKKLTINYPFNASHNIWLARCHEKLQNIESARFYYRRAISIDPFNATYHGRYACFSYKKLNIMDEAKHHFEKSLNLKNSLSVVHRDYGHYLQCIEHDWNRALFHYNECLKLFPKDDECHYFFAKLLHSMSKYSLSEMHFTKCIEFQKERTGFNFFKYHFDYALLLKSMKKYNECNAQFIIALNLNDKWFRVHLEYGLLLCEHFSAKQNRFNEGLKFVNHALSMKPHSKKLQSLYEALKSRNTSNANVGIDSNDGSSCALTDDTNEIDDSSNSAEMIPTQKVNDVGDGDFEEKMEIARKCRQSEFSRFVERIQLDDHVLDLYFLKSQEMKLNDIRLVNMTETRALIEGIVGANNIGHFEMFQNTIHKFKRDSQEFMEWLKSMKLGSEYYDLFEKYGILTFESFDHHLKSENDLLWLIGEKNKTDATCIWNNVQNKIIVKCQ